MEEMYERLLDKAKWLEERKYLAGHYSIDPLGCLLHP
jgi:hypothetical protein